jgi:IclR family pca regulon transcriptional regulator
MAARKSPQGNPDFIAGLGKGLGVIECFDDEHAQLTIAGVAAKTGLSRAAARRCLLTLQELGYVDYDSNLFRLTPRVLRLGYAYIVSSELPQIVQPHLERLSGQIRESCSASILDGGEILYIARAATKRIMSVNLGVGTRLPAYCTSMGRVLLAALDPDEAARRIASSRRTQFTPHTRTRKEELAEILRSVREKGYCVIDQELEIGLVSMAVPVFNNAGQTVAALNIGTQAPRVNAAEMPARFLPALLEAQKSLRPLINKTAPITI